MPTWRCPHCGTPQAEAARCWVCRRSSTACVTCRNFRRSVAANLGYCALDRRRAPLIGDEIRACWEAARPSPAGGPLDGDGVSIARPLARRDEARSPAPRASDRPGVMIDFVEIGGDAPRQAAPPAPTPTPGRAEGDGPDVPVEGRGRAPATSMGSGWSFWADLER